MLPHNTSEIVRCGQAMYEQQIRDKVEALHKGKMLVLDVDTGGYEIDADTLAALNRVRAKRPQATPYVVRVGSPTTVKLGGQFTVSKPCR